MEESNTQTPSGLKELTDMQKEDVNKNKDVAAMSYIWILSVVVLYARRDSPFIQHHARQGLWLFLISIPVWIIPRVGHYIEFIVLAGMIIGFINAAQGRFHDIPIVGQLAKGTLTLWDIWKSFLSLISKSWGVVKDGVVPKKGREGREMKEGSEAVLRQAQDK